MWYVENCHFSSKCFGLAPTVQHFDFIASLVHNFFLKFIWRFCPYYFYFLIFYSFYKFIIKKIKIKYKPNTIPDPIDILISSSPLLTEKRKSRGSIPFRRRPFSSEVFAGNRRHPSQTVIDHRQCGLGFQNPTFVFSHLKMVATFVNTPNWILRVRVRWFVFLRTIFGSSWSDLEGGAGVSLSNLLHQCVIVINVSVQAVFLRLI